MTEDPKVPLTVTVLRLRVTSDGDPSLLTRLLGYFQNLNVTPRRVTAEWGSNALMHLAIDVCGLDEDVLTRIAGKVGSAPCVLNSHWHHL
jgi:hypothetical protein